MPKAGKAMEYINYAKHCLDVVKLIPDREARIAMREMAGEWMNLAGQLATDDMLDGEAERQTKRRSKTKLRAVN